MKPALGPVTGGAIETPVHARSAYPPPGPLPGREGGRALTQALPVG